MTKEEFEQLIAEDATFHERVQDEQWVIVTYGVEMRVFTNKGKDRMRIMAPVAFNEKASEEHLRRALSSNFHSDARYGLREDKLYALFIHALSSLHETDLRSAIRQVAELVRSFGTTYSGGLLRFQWPRPEPESGGMRRRSVEQVQESNKRMHARLAQDSTPGSEGD